MGEFLQSEQHLQSDNMVNNEAGKPGLIARFADRLTPKRLLAAAIIATTLKLNADALAQEPHLSELTPSQKQTVETVTGLTLSELSKNFIVQIPVESENNLYIVHIGQTHVSPKVYERAVKQNKVIRLQKLIEPVIEGIVKTNNLKCVFSEGIDEKEEIIGLHNFIKDGEKTLGELMKKPIRNIHDMTEIYERFSLFDSIINNTYIYNFLGPLLRDVREKMREALKNKIILKNKAGNNIVSFIETALNLSEVNFNVKSLEGDPNPYIPGAEFKMVMDSKLEFLCPTENKELNEQALVALDRQDSIKKAYYAIKKKLQTETISSGGFKDWDNVKIAMQKIDEKNLSESDEEELDRAKNVIDKMIEINNNNEVIALKEQLTEAEATAHYLADTLREDEVLRNIVEHDKEARAKGKKPGHVGLVYGWSHDFSPKLIEFNTGNPDRIQRGIIKITPKEKN